MLGHTTFWTLHNTILLIDRRARKKLLGYSFQNENQVAHFAVVIHFRNCFFQVINVVKCVHSLWLKSMNKLCNACNIGAWKNGVIYNLKFTLQHDAGASVNNLNWPENNSNAAFNVNLLSFIAKICVHDRYLPCAPCSPHDFMFGKKWNECKT